MKAGWQTKRLGEICGFVRGPFGGSLKKSVFVDDGFAVYEQQHAIYNQFESVRYFIGIEKFKEMQRFELHPNDLIMSCSGTMGKVAIVPDIIRPGIINQALLKLTPSSSISSEFLKYWMDSTNFQNSLKEQSGGAAIQNVASVSILKEIKILLPPLHEQQRIVAILDEAFEGIAAAAANAKKNLNNARELFKSYLQSVFTQRGEGWVDTALGDLCGFVRGPFGGSLKKSIFVNDGYAVYEQQHAIYNQFDNIRYFIDEVKFKEMKRFELLPNDLIMSCSGTMGRVAIIPKGTKRGIINQALLKLTPSAKISNAFLKSWMESEAFQDALKEYSGGAAIQNVASVKILKEIRIPLPSIKEQERIVSKLGELKEETQRLEAIYQQKLVALDDLKKSILNQAFSGQLNIKAAA